MSPHLRLLLPLPLLGLIAALALAGCPSPKMPSGPPPEYEEPPPPSWLDAGPPPDAGPPAPAPPGDG